MKYKPTCMYGDDFTIRKQHFTSGLARDLPVRSHDLDISSAVSSMAHISRDLDRNIGRCRLHQSKEACRVRLVDVHSSWMQPGPLKPPILEAISARQHWSKSGISTRSMVPRRRHQLVTNLDGFNGLGCLQVLWTSTSRTIHDYLL